MFVTLTFPNVFTSLFFFTLFKIIFIELSSVQNILCGNLFANNRQITKRRNRPGQSTFFAYYLKSIILSFPLMFNMLPIKWGRGSSFEVLFSICRFKKNLCFEKKWGRGEATSLMLSARWKRYVTSKNNGTLERAIHLLLELGFAILASGNFFKIGEKKFNN